MTGPDTPESIFADWLARREAGEAMSYEELLRQHPEHAEHFAEYRALERAVEGVLRKAGLRGVFSEEPSVPTKGDAASGAEEEVSPRFEASEDVLERLSSRSTPSSRYRRKKNHRMGGMGVILRVWDEDLRRHLAMKIMRRAGKGEDGELEVSPRELTRFLEEARITGQLEHPNIVPVHELGVDPDRGAYFTMKFVKGRTLDEVFDELHRGEGGWTHGQVLGLILKVCEAMSYAHAQGVIHRDLKPGNVMVGEFGELYVMDWGFAKVLGRADTRDLRLAEPAVGKDLEQEHGARSDDAALASPIVTMDGEALGTPCYMPPEQALGQLDRMGPASDVYSVGAMLYALLAGRTPYIAPGTEPKPRAVLASVKAGPPDPIRELHADAPVELVAICEKAMARDNTRRYEDMQALARDLSAYVEGRVVRAYETGAWAETRKWVTRNKGVAASLATIFVLLAVGLIATDGLRKEALAQAELAEQRLTRSEESERAAKANEDEALRQAGIAEENARLAEASERNAREQEAIATRRTTEVLRLSALQDLEGLLTEAGALWPPHPENIERYDDWMSRAEELVGELPAHYATREELRAFALPRSEEQRQAERESHPAREELAALSAEMAAKERALLRRRDGVGPELRELDLSPWPDTATALVGQASARVMIDRTVFGQEELGLAMALRARELASGTSFLALVEPVLAHAFFALGLDDDARTVCDTAAANFPTQARRDAYEAKFLKEIREAIEAASSDDGILAAEEELRRLTEERTRLEDRVDERRQWSFPPDRRDEAWWNAQLTSLIAGLEALSAKETGLLARNGISPDEGWSVPRRRAFAQGLRDGFEPGGSYLVRWEEALPQIREDCALPSFEPQMGLVPIGKDPSSGLWEFHHLASGEEPKRSRDGGLVMREESGVVLVLIPGSTFWMGAQSEVADGRNYDPNATRPESPVHEVEVSPFLLSKYELTQAQWIRLRGHNPSRYVPPYRPKGRKRVVHTLLHPVEQVSWLQCEELLRSAGLTFPTEAQWEYACRATTRTPWETGEEGPSLYRKRAANLADQAAIEWGAVAAHVGAHDDLNDGYGPHSPVGAHEPNGFGLHDMHGNVAEWCYDAWDGLWYHNSPKRDPALSPHGDDLRVNRGGSYLSSLTDARCANRFSNTPTTDVPTLGVRPARSLD